MNDFLYYRGQRVSKLFIKTHLYRRVSNSRKKSINKQKSQLFRQKIVRPMVGITVFNHHAQTPFG